MEEGAMFTEAVFAKLEEAADSPEEIVKILGLSEADIAAALRLAWLTQEDRDNLESLRDAAVRLEQDKRIPSLTSVTRQPSSTDASTRADPNVLTRAQQRQIDLTTAVCQERIYKTHVEQCIALVSLVAPELPYETALDIYARLLRLNPEQARNVGSRARARIAQHPGGGPAFDSYVMEEEDEVEPSAPTEMEIRAREGRLGALFSRIRRRVRGRVNEELRRKVSLTAARAEDTLFEVHVQNALTFSDALAGQMSFHDAVDMYLHTMAIPDGVSDVIYNRALRIAAEGVLPRVDETAGEIEVVREPATA